jgi:hypothetical protein
LTSGNYFGVFPAVPVPGNPDQMGTGFSPDTMCPVLKAFPETGFLAIERSTTRIKE